MKLYNFVLFYKRIIIEIKNAIRKIGLTLPPIRKPSFNYIPINSIGNLYFVSGQLPWLSDDNLIQGKANSIKDIELGKSASKQCVLNFLSLLSHYQIDKDIINKIIKLSVFVNSSSTFIDLPRVADGASNLIIDFFGKKVGSHSRTAVGVNSLPRNAMCEVDFIFSKNQ